MKQLILHITLLLCLFAGQSMASELLKLRRVDSQNSIQLYFSFDKTPSFSNTVNEKRINLIFTATKQSPDLKIFTTDSRIVKVLTRQLNDDLILSLFFRYKPQFFSFTRSEDDKVVFEVLPGNQFSKSYKDLADKLKGLTVLDRSSTDFTNPYITSPYVKDWMSFFSKYESIVNIEIPVKFTPPPFPVIRLMPPGKELNMKILSTKMFELADQQQWDQLADLVLDKLQSESDMLRKKLFALTYGEALFRANNFDGAFKQLYLLNEKYAAEFVGSYAKYLLLLLRANLENPYIADFELKSLDEEIGPANPLAPYLLLSQIETALVTGQYKRMNKLLLRDNVAFPDMAEKIREIRQADYWYAIKQPIKAYAAYSLLAKSPLLPTKPYSLNGYCSTLYNQKIYRKSSRCYEQLSSLIINKDSLGIIRYRENMAKLKFEAGDALIVNFAQIEHAFPDTEAGYRSELKKTDLMLLQDTTRSKWALDVYRTIADESILRATTGEALFKQALLYSMLGQEDQAIVLLKKITREFGQGDIKQSAQALLIELLPDEIKRLVDQKEYIKALVLAKQNRDLFEKNWLDSKNLADIAEAYQNIGIYDEAQKIYLYLIGIVRIDQKEQFYLPMIKASFNHGNYNLVEDYSAQYSYNYPQGKHTTDILFIRLQALVAAGRLDKASTLLPSPLTESVPLYRLAASLFYRTNNYLRCTEVYRKLIATGTALNQTEQIMYAESLLAVDDLAGAEEIFQQINKDNPFFEQSLFRLAELERRKGKEKNALRLFRKIVETGSNERWKRFAQKELQFAEAAARM